MKWSHLYVLTTYRKHSVCVRCLHTYLTHIHLHYLLRGSILQCTKTKVFQNKNFNPNKSILGYVSNILEMQNWNYLFHLFFHGRVILQTVIALNLVNFLDRKEKQTVTFIPSFIQGRARSEQPLMESHHQHHTLQPPESRRQSKA